MPLPLILGLGAAAAGALGIGTGIHGAVKMKDANDTMKLCQTKHEENLAYFEKTNKTTTNDMDILGKKELEILTSFQEFSDVFEKIHNRPEFKTYEQSGVKIPTYNAEEIKKVSVGAGVLLGGLGGAAMGTAGGFAAAGATTAAVMTFGTASTGTAIASLSGAAATKATLAAIGGGAIKVGGGGIALGTTILGTATLGVGIMVGGIIFNIVGSSISDKADTAYEQVRKEREEINKICDYLLELSKTATEYTTSISVVQKIYAKQLDVLNYIVYTLNKRDWSDFSEGEKLITENTVLLVGLLYNMCKVELVLKAEDDSQINNVNKVAVDKAISDAETFLSEKELMITTDNDQNYQKIRGLIRESLKIGEYYKWISPLNIKIYENSIMIKASSKTYALYVKEHYSSQIESAITQCLNKTIPIVYGYPEDKHTTIL